MLLRLLSLARRGVLGFDFRHFLRPLHIASSCSPYQSIRRHLRHVPLITIYSLVSSHVSPVPATCLHATMRAMSSQDREPSLSKMSSAIVNVSPPPFPLCLFSSMYLCRGIYTLIAHHYRFRVRSRALTTIDFPFVYRKGLVDAFCLCEMCHIDGISQLYIPPTGCTKQ